MRDFVDACEDAELHVYSNKGKYQYSNGKEEKGKDAKQSLGGTLVTLRLCHTASDINIGDYNVYD